MSMKRKSEGKIKNIITLYEILTCHAMSASFFAFEFL
jgi:hypothetical protein